MKIKKGDKVRVIAGKHKGVEALVKKTAVDKRGVMLEGMNIIKKHQKANPNTQQQGKIIESEGFIHVSNVALIHPKNKKKVTKISYALDKNNKKIRITRDKKARL